MTKIIVSDVQFLGYHGITESERVVGHRMRLDIEAEIQETASLTDSLNESVDYAKLAERAVALCNEHPCHTLEFACARIGQGLLREFRPIVSMTLSLSKLNPSLAITIGAVGIQQRFSRESAAPVTF